MKFLNSYNKWKHNLERVILREFSIKILLVENDDWAFKWWPLGLTNPHHNFEHLVEVFNNIEEGDPAELKIAALYHDFGYNPEISGSANINTAVGRMRQDLTSIGIPQEFIQKVENLIRSTEDHKPHSAFSLKLIRADLKVLTLKRGYEDYARAIRSEYRTVPRMDYIAGRLSVLENLMTLCDKHNIFDKNELKPAYLEIKSLRIKVNASQKTTTALYAGSFDPFHRGHLQIVKEANLKGYKVTVAIMHNPEKSKSAISPRIRAGLIMNDLLNEGIGNVSVKVIENPRMDITGVMALNGCTVLLRGVRSDDPKSVSEELTLSRILKAESQINTILIQTQGHMTSYSSSSAKTLVSYGYPAKMLSALTRKVYDDAAAGRPQLTLVVGGIATGKSTYCSKLIKDTRSRVIDLDWVAAKYLGLHPVFSNETVEDRLKNYCSLKKYRGYMDRIRPTIMAGLHQELSEVPEEVEKVYIAVNKLGIVQDTLLRMCNYRVHYLSDISDDEALNRVIGRGSNLRTLKVIRALERYAPSVDELRNSIARILVNVTARRVGLDHGYVTSCESFSVKVVG